MRRAFARIYRGAVTVPAMRHDRLLFVLVPLYLMVVGALVIHKIWFREEAKPIAIENKAPVAKEDKAPAVNKADDAGSQTDESGARCRTRAREESLAPHRRYRKPLHCGRLHSAVYDPNVGGANNGSNGRRSKDPRRDRRLARRPPWPRSSEPPPAGEAAARRQRQSTSSQWQAGRDQRLVRYNLPNLYRRHADVHPLGISRDRDV